jgi:hypothetical protein
MASSGPLPRNRATTSLAPSRASAAPNCSGDAFFQLHPPGRNIHRGNAHRPAQQAHRRQHIGAARLQQGSVSVPAVTKRTMSRITSALIRRAFWPVRGFHLFGNRHAATALISRAR